MRWLNDYGDVPPWYWGPVFWRSRYTGRSLAAARAVALVLAVIG